MIFGQNIMVKIVALFLIALLVFYFFVPGLYQGIRGALYNLFKRSVSLYLSHQTSDYYSVTGNNFEVKYTQGDNETAPFVLEAAEKYFGIVQQELGYTSPKGDKILLVLYSNQEALNESFGWTGEKRAVGVYWAGSIRLLSPHSWLGNHEDNASLKRAFLKESPLSHELVHFLVDDQTKGNYTRWYTEGLAQYIEEKITGFNLDEPTYQDRKRLYPLKVLDGSFDSQPNQVLAYWQSLETVRYLIGEFGMEATKEFLILLGKGTNFAKAFNKIYGISLSDLEKNVQKRVIEKYTP